MTRTVQTFTPCEIAALVVTCRKCQTSISFPLDVSHPAIECPHCKALIALQDIARLAEAIRVIQRAPRASEGADVEIEIEACPGE